MKIDNQKFHEYLGYLFIGIVIIFILLVGFKFIEPSELQFQVVVLFVSGFCLIQLGFSTIIEEIRKIKGDDIK